MKTINMTDANQIIGGACFSKSNCKDTYEWFGGSTVLVCRKVTTCTDKHGKTVSSTASIVNTANCK